MKLRNKQTGEIATLTLSSNGEELLLMKNNEMVTRNVKLSDLEEWEDYEEPKGTALRWIILTLENFIENEPDDKWIDLEDCKQMLEKLKAWKRLKDKGFKFGRWQFLDGRPGVWVRGNYVPDIADELDAIFGGEE